MLININSTEDALEFGRTCDPEILPKMHKLRQILSNFATQAQFQNKLNLAMKYACQAQVMRKAIEAFETRARKEIVK